MNLDTFWYIHTRGSHIPVWCGALEDNETWSVTELPKGKRAVGSKWIYKLKLKSDGSTQRYKARLVAKWYNQIEGVHYMDIFSLVAKAVTISILLAVACKQHWFLHQLDINNAFLHAYIEEEIYMHPPQGYKVPKGHLCKLKRSETGMIITQSKYVKDILTDTGMTQSKATNTTLPVELDSRAGSREQLQKPKPAEDCWLVLYLGFTRPDICHATQQLSQYMQQPCKDHWDAALHLVRYLKGTVNRGLHFNSTDSFDLEAFCDSDWATCKETRRSLTGTAYSWEEA
ncbi:uncharacterized protein LOC110011383 [Sesamum indicum]|uniref:Uncharacterized protein LOC110011383 n=1 Tax=Sesamum indicum TaxID=4182 RepID=A0A8M8UT28_SESIN|nr:uncharacterized protein LOC110011383 [Sesamum indicum]